VGGPPPPPAASAADAYRIAGPPASYHGAAAAYAAGPAVVSWQQPQAAPQLQRRQQAQQQPQAFAGMSMEEAALQMALQEEADRAARRGAGGASAMAASIQFQEVNASALKYVDPSRREANEGLRAALGTGYAAAIRAEAAPFEGDKMAKRKHQIGTLFHNAKMKELEILENRASGMKSKAETQGKYGW
jgi:proline-rich protein PRCC